MALVDDLRHAATTTGASGVNGIDVAAIEHLDARSLAVLREDGVDRQTQHHDACRSGDGAA